MWIATSEPPKSPGYPFYGRLTAILEANDFDRVVEGMCAGFYASVLGTPGLLSGPYFHLLLVGNFEGIDSERGIAWRATDSLAVLSFLRLAFRSFDDLSHPTLDRSRDPPRGFHVGAATARRGGLLWGKTVAIDVTTLEANAAMRSIVRRDTGESYQEFLVRLAKASGIKTPTREALA